MENIKEMPNDGTLTTQVVIFPAVDTEAPIVPTKDEQVIAESPIEQQPAATNILAHSVEIVSDAVLYKRGGLLKAWKLKHVKITDGAIEFKNLSTLAEKHASDADFTATLARLTVSATGFLIFTEADSEMVTGVVELAKITGMKASRLHTKAHSFVISSADREITLAAHDDQERDNLLYTIESTKTALKDEVFDTSSIAFIDAVALISSGKAFETEPVAINEETSAPAEPKVGMFQKLSQTLTRGGHKDDLVVADVSMEQPSDLALESVQVVEDVTAAELNGAKVNLFTKLTKTISRQMKSKDVVEPIVADKEIVEGEAESEETPVAVADEKEKTSFFSKIASTLSRSKKDTAPVETAEQSDVTVEVTTVETVAVTDPIEVEVPVVKESLLTKLSKTLARKHESVEPDIESGDVEVAQAIEVAGEEATETPAKIGIIAKITRTLTRTKVGEKVVSDVVTEEIKVGEDAPAIIESADETAPAALKRFSIANAFKRASKMLSKDVVVKEPVDVAALENVKEPAESVVIEETIIDVPVAVVEEPIADVSEPVFVSTSEESKVEEVSIAEDHAACSPKGSMMFNLFGKKAIVEPPVEGAIISGWMEKQSAVFKTWNRRFFALTATEDGQKHLTYYRPGSMKPAGSFANVECKTTQSGGNKAAFKVVVANKSNFLVAAADQATADLWMRAISA